MAYDTWEAARLISWSNKQAGIGPLTEAELIEWIEHGVGELEWAYTLEEDGEETKYIDFPTLISLRLICLLRFQGAMLETFAEVAPRLREDLGVDWPYATEHFWSSYTRQSPTYSKSKQAGQRAKWERNYSKFSIDRNLRLRIDANLEYGKDGVASTWLPFKDVAIDPQVVSGAPCVVGTRTPTWALTGISKDEVRIRELAKGYRLSEEQVRNALDWERQLDASVA